MSGKNRPSSSWTAQRLRAPRPDLSKTSKINYSGLHNEDQLPVTNASGIFGKVRQLTKLYGSAALVVYGILGAVDFGLSFMLIYLVGTEHVQKAEDWVLGQLNWKRASPIHETDPATTAPTSSSDQSILWTTAVVAYTIHKTILLPVRVGLTAWVTPPIVRALRKRGWKLGKTSNIH